MLAVFQADTFSPQTSHRSLEDFAAVVCEVKAPGDVSIDLNVERRRRTVGRRGLPKK